MSKAIEEIKQKHWKFMCTVKNNGKSKMTLPTPSFHNFINC